MDAGDLTDAMKRSIMFLSRTMSLERRRQKMKLKVMYLGNANVTVRKDSEEGWLIERTTEDGVMLLRKLDKEPSVNMLREVLKQYYPDAMDLVLRQED